MRPSVSLRAVHGRRFPALPKLADGLAGELLARNLFVSFVRSWALPVFGAPAKNHRRSFPEEAFPRPSCLGGDVDEVISLLSGFHRGFGAPGGAPERAPGGAPGPPQCGWADAGAADALGPAMAGEMRSDTGGRDDS